MARQARAWTRSASRRMPEATGDIREIVGQPVFVPLYKLFLTYGKIFRLSFGPKSFVVISDAAMAKQARSPCCCLYRCCCSRAPAFDGMLLSWYASLMAFFSP